MRTLLLAAALLVSGNARADDAPKSVDPANPPTLEQLLAMPQEKLDELYRGAEAGPAPSGDYKGKASLNPGTFIGVFQRDLLSALWYGKRFVEDDLYNFVFGRPSFRGKTYVAESWFDGKPSRYIDYRETSPVIHEIHDEFRMLAPGLYIGRTYMRGDRGTIVLNFVFRELKEGEPLVDPAPERDPHADVN